MQTSRNRYVQRSWEPVEITTGTLQGRYLLRPSVALNQLFVGVLAKALQHHNVKLHAAVVLSSHYHVIASPENVKELSDFMRFVDGQLSSEVGRLHDWPGGMWHRRFASIPISGEEEAQISRLKYVLSNSCKEGLVLSPARLARRPLRDHPRRRRAAPAAFGSTARGTTRQRSAARTWELSDFEEHLDVDLEPLPCWEHLDEATWRGYVADLVEQVEEGNPRDAPSQRHRAGWRQGGAADGSASAQGGHEPVTEAAVPRVPEGGATSDDRGVGSVGRGVRRGR